MEENIPIQPVRPDLYPRYSKLPDIHTGDIRVLLSQYTTDGVVECIRLHTHNQVKSQLEREIKVNAIASGGTILGAFSGIPAITVNGSVEEAAGILFCLTVSAFFAQKIRSCLASYTIAANAETLPKNHPLLQALPSFYDQLVAEFQPRIHHSAKKLASLRVHYSSDIYGNHAARIDQLKNLQKELEDIEQTLICFPLEIDRQLVIAREKLENILFEDAVPSITNTLLRNTWKTWDALEERMFAVEDSLTARKTTRLTYPEL